MTKINALGRKAKKSNACRALGFTLVEVAMVLSVAALIIAGVMLFYLSASRNNQVKNTLNELALIASTVKQQYGNQPDYSELSTSDIVKSGSIPANLIDSSGNLRNPFGGTVGINRSGYRPGMFAVAFTDIPVDACIKLVVADLGPQVFLVNVDFGDGAFGRSMSLGDAYYRCGINNPNQKHIIAWTFE